MRSRLFDDFEKSYVRFRFNPWFEFRPFVCYLLTLHATHTRTGFAFVRYRCWTANKMLLIQFICEWRMNDNDERFECEVDSRFLSLRRQFQMNLATVHLQQKRWLHLWIEAWFINLCHSVLSLFNYKWISSASTYHSHFSHSLLVHNAKIVLSVWALALCHQPLTHVQCE